MAVAEKILIKHARAYDPAQQWHGEVRDIYLAEGRVSEAFDDPQRIIDAGERPLLAGGIDPHCQVAAPGQILAQVTDGYPSPAGMGRLYARMGYVHTHHPFMNLLTAGLVSYTLGSIPFVDTSTCISIDLRDMGHSIRANQPETFCRLARGLIQLTGATGLFLPFPFLRHKQRHYIQKNLSPKKVLSFLSALEDPEILPIRLWGMPGLLENDFPAPEKFHISGLGYALDCEASLFKAREFLEAGGSADLGLPLEGEEVIIACESSISNGISLDMGLERPLSLFTRATNPGSPETAAAWSLLDRAAPQWRLALSASGPAGGQPGNMPVVISRLLDPGTCPPESDREQKDSPFNLYQWAHLSRVEPARYLRLSDMGHLGIGARAQVAIYDLEPQMDSEQIKTALSGCWCLIKDGICIRENGEFTGQLAPACLQRRRVEVDLSGLLSTELLQNPTLRYEHLGLAGIKGPGFESG